MAPKFRFSDRNQVSMMALCLDDLLPREHEVRTLLAYVESMDLSMLIASVRTLAGEGGAPAFDPRMLLALWLYGTARGVGSARLLEQMCRESLPFRWLCADDAPNYHTLADFRTAHGDLLDALLTENLAVLVSEGLLVPEELTVAHDGIRVRASAGRSSFRRKPTLEQALVEASKRVQELKTEAGNEPRADRARAAENRAAREREERVKKAIEKMKELEEKRRKKGRGAPRISTTDPDAMRMKMGNGGYDPGYNIQITTAVGSGIITAVGVAGCGSDYGELSPAVKQHKRRLGKLPTRILGDSGFAEYDDIIALDTIGCEALVPDQNGTTLQGRKDPALDRWRDRMAKPENMQTYKTDRPANAEWTNAQLRNHGLRRITVRGRAKALVIAMWNALTHNILRTIALRNRLQATA